MKITLKSRRPVPIWLTRRMRDFYYRVALPARMTGGRVLHVLQIVNRARQVENFDIFDANQRRQFAALPEATILGLGSTIVIPLAQIHANDPSWLAILRALRDSGVQVFLEQDDDVLHFFAPAEITAISEELAEKERAGIVSSAKRLLPWMTEDAINAWVESNLPRLIEEKSKSASTTITAQYAALFAVTTPLCSTEQMCLRVQGRFGRELPVAVAPNVIDPADFPATSREGETVRVGYAGTRSHDEDMALAIPGFLECAKLPNVELVFFGWHPRWEEAPSFEPGTFEWQGIVYRYGGQFVDFGEFIRQVGVLDIAAAPLLDTPFNRTKSSQKWFEHSMHRTAMVLSDSPVYNCVEHGVTGFKARTAEEFTHYMRLLVENAALRRQMGGMARRAVLARWTVDQWADHWRQTVLA